MADQQNNSGSPWEEVLEEPETKTQPQIVGTLENQTPDIPQGQFKVPGDIPEGVGSKVPAENIQIDKSEPEQPNRPIEPKQSTGNVSQVSPKPASSKSGLFGILKKKTPQTGSANPVNIQPLQKQQPASPVPNKEMSVAKVPPAPKTTNQPEQSQPNIVNNLPPVRPVASTKVPPQPTPQPSAQPVSSKPAPINTVAKPSLFSWFRRPKVIIAAILIVLLVGLTYFNETGVFASGIEKVYGLFHLESLWGGLPADSQLALARSFSKMSSQTSLKIDSKIKFTVNRNSESPVTKPLLSYQGSPAILFALDKAILASESDTYQLSTDQTTEALESPSASSTLDSSLDDTEGQTDQTTDSTNSSSSVSDQTTQSQSSSGTSSISTVKEFSTSAKAYLSDEGASAQLEISSESNKTSNLNLYQQSGRLYASSSGIDYSGSSKNWVYYDLTSKSQETLPAVFQNLNLNGFSVTGKRIGSGKFNDIPVYRYQVNIKIGSLLENIGVQDEMINTITGEIDIGKKDQLIYYLNLVITPSISSAITRIDIETAISDYGVQEVLSIPTTASKIEDGTAVDEIEAVEPLTTPGISTGLLERDAQRKTDLKTIEAALKKYYNDFLSYPSSNGIEIETRIGGNSLAKALVPKYLGELPVDPMSDKYYYGYESNGTTYKLTALLGNNQDPSGTKVGDKNFYIIQH